MPWVEGTSDHNGYKLSFSAVIVSWPLRINQPSFPIKGKLFERSQE
jgi:hypothetical protein